MLEAVIYTLLILSLCSFFLKNLSRQIAFVILVGIALLCQFPIFKGLSVVEWLDSFCGIPSIFLGLLALSTLFVHFFAPREIVFPLRSKLFVAIFGAVLYFGSLNLLFGFDLYAWDFDYQVIVVLTTIATAFLLDRYLGILYLICVFFYCLDLEGRVSIFSYMIDVLVWIYALVGSVVDSLKTLKNKNRF